MTSEITMNLTATQMQRIFDVANVRTYEAQNDLRAKGQQNTYIIVLRHNEGEKPQTIINKALKLSANELKNLRSIAKAIQAIDSLITRQTPEDSHLYTTKNALFADLKESGYQLGTTAGDYKLTKI